MYDVILFTSSVVNFIALFAAPQTSGSVSPVSNVSAHSADDRQQQQGTLQLHACDVRSKSKSLPRLNQDLQNHSSLDGSPSSSPSSKTNLFSQFQAHYRVASNPNVTQYGDDLSSGGNHRHSSPITLAKHLFNMTTLKNSLSPSYGSPKNSPRSSPLLGRKRFRGHRNQSGHEDRESHLMYWWMEDVREGESRHWKQVLDREGEWSYYWHSIHYRLQPAYS